MADDKKRRPEREMGAAPPDYMPAIFGWMSLEEMAEQANELVDFTAKLKPKRKGK